MKRITLNLLLILCTTVSLAFLGNLLYNKIFSGKAKQWIRNKKPFGILLIGESNSSVNFRNVTFICVAIINPKLSRVGFISFLPKIKINANAPSMEELIITNNGFLKIKKIISKIISFDIPFSINFKVSDISRAIDLLEGLPYFLSQSDILEGEQLPVDNFFLDGSMVNTLLNIQTNAEHSVAFQVDRYYSLLLNLWSIRKKKWKILKEKIIFDQAISNLTSNLSNKELYSVAKLFLSNNYWLPLLFEMPLRKEKDIYLLNKEAAAIHFRDFQTMLTQEKNSIFEKPPNIEVRNGTNVPNLAKKVGVLLNRKGLRVLEFTNANHHNHKETILLDVSGKYFYLESVAKSLKIKKFYHAINKTQFTDLVLILGEDFLNNLADLKE